MVLIYFQLLILGAICLGWTYWLHRWTTDGEWRWLRTIVLFSASFAVQILLLQNLVYLDIPIQYSFPLPAVIGLAGLWRLIGVWRSKVPFPPAFRRNLRAGAALFLAIYSLQSVAAMVEGPSNYYGKGHIDHLNYAYIGEFLRILPFSTPDGEMLTQPWLVKPIQYKNLRLGQSVAHAYVASLSFVSAKEAYAGLCSFLAAMLALAMFGLAQSFSLSRSYSLLAALWVGLAPSTTKIHLEGFLSQASVLFIFPLLIVWARLPRETLRFRLVTGALLASYLLVAYTEFYVIGVFLLGMLTLASLALRSYRQLLISSAVTMISLVLVPAYLPRAIQFVRGQYAIASGRSPALEVLAPDSGTVYGWTKALIEIPIGPPPVARQAMTAAGILLLAISCIGLLSRSKRNQVFLAAATVTPIVFLGILLSAPVLAKYPFMKISDSFTFLWVLLAMRGISLAAMWACRQWRMLAPAALHFAPGGLVLLAGLGFLVQNRAIASQQGPLSLLYQKPYTDTLQFVAAHPERTYIIRFPDGLAAGWIAYEARYSRVYIVSRSLSDVPLSPDVFAFAKMPDGLTPDRVTSITPEGHRNIPVSGDAVDWEVYNPQGQDGGGSALWYWLGDSMSIEFYRWSGANPKEYTLSFRAEPGPAHPSPNRTIRLTNLRTGQQETIRFAGTTKLTVPIALIHGNNSFRLESVEPIEQVNHVPGDLRKHMTHLDSFSVIEPKSAGDSLPRPPQRQDGNEIPLAATH